jgi:hypothetical protein
MNTTSGGIPMRRISIPIFLFLLLAGFVAGAQEIDEPVASARLEGGTTSRNGAFNAYATGAVEGNNYYLITTNSYFGIPNQPPGECRYFDAFLGTDRRIGEKVVGYEGDNTFAFLQGPNPGFTRLRVASPCFDGRYGEPTEQDHRTVAYGGGSLVYSPTKSKYYLSVNRTRIRKTPSSTDPAELASSGTNWNSGDFDQIFFGAYASIDNALHRPTSSSQICRGELSPPASETCTPSLAWNWVPLVQITDGLVDPVDGMTKTFTALPPLLAAYDASVESLSIFNGIGARGAVLFGFMEFGHICTSWNASTTPPTCTSPGFPNRLAAVYLSDTGGIRPTGARLHFKQGSNWIAMNRGGTFPSVPDNFSSLFPMAGYADVKFNPITSKWRIWGSRRLNSPPASGCADSHSTYGAALSFADISGGSVVEFWPTQNGFGRSSAHAHYVFAPACSCTREFIFYSSTDWACYNDPKYNTSSNPLIGFEVAVRRWLDGPPAQ